MSLDFYLSAYREVDVFDANITHNLNRMAEEAGVYDALWRPDENGYYVASDIIQVLEDGLAKLLADPDHFKAMNPSNGWGDYYGLVKFVMSVLEACRGNPDAKIRVWR